MKQIDIEVCKKYLPVGTKVNVNLIVKDENEKKEVVKKAVVHQRCFNFITVEYEDSGLKESFFYADIISQKVVTLRKDKETKRKTKKKAKK